MRRKNKKPIYKRWWFYAIIVIIAIGAIGSSGDTDSPAPAKTASTASPAAAAPKEPEAPAVPEPDPEPEPMAIHYEPYGVTELFDAMNDNPLKAERTYQDQYVELYGYLGTIDSDGKYITIGAGEDDWDYMFQSVQCFITSDMQVDQIIEMNKGDFITVRGKIKDIGEIMGYTLDIDSIN